jgi:hypothetical protein
MEYQLQFVDRTDPCYLHVPCFAAWVVERTEPAS